jgi:glc operon protein GlcG
MRNAIAYCLALGAVVLLGQSAQAQLLEKKALTLAAARKMVAAAEAEAQRNNWRGVVAVVDDGGWIILLERMDHAALTAGVELAAGKARSAALFKKPTQALEEAINHGRYAAITARGFIEMQGGLPVVVDGEVIGGIGASFADARGRRTGRQGRARRAQRVIGGVGCS